MGKHSTRQKEEIKIKPLDLKLATRKEDLDRLRGLQQVEDPERGPQNKPRRGQPGVRQR